MNVVATAVVTCTATAIIANQTVWDMLDDLVYRSRIWWRRNISTRPDYTGCHRLQTT